MPWWIDLARFLVANTAACRNARLGWVAPQLGIRSGRRIRGRATLTDKDVLGARKARTGDRAWVLANGALGTARRHLKMLYFDEGHYYDISLDCLRPVELDNVLVAGRCFSAEAGAMSSARVIGTALATGWAAGTVAAFQAKGRPADEAVDLIRKQMDE